MREAVTQVFDTPEQIAFFQLAAMKGRLKLEVKGLKFRGRSTYSIAKERYGLKGSRESVLAQLEAMVEEAIAKKQRGEG
jgi:hypothetical protein